MDDTDDQPAGFNLHHLRAALGDDPTVELPLMGRLTRPVPLAPTLSLNVFHDLVETEGRIGAGLPPV